MISEASKLRLSGNAAFQALDDRQTVILSFDSGYLYTCNRTTADMLALADGSRTLGGIADAIAQRYDVAREVLLADLVAMAERLAAEELLVLS